MSAPRSSNNDAVRRWPPRQACQNASLTCSAVAPASTSSAVRASSPNPAACHTRSTPAPLATRRRATCQHPYPMALSSGVPMDPLGASMSAPHSMRTAATSASSLLAAQCNGVSPLGPSVRASTVAPASIKARTTQARGEVARPVGRDVQRGTSFRRSRVDWRDRAGRPRVWSPRPRRRRGSLAQARASAPSMAGLFRP